jgi:hypothetical protein
VTLWYSLINIYTPCLSYGLQAAVAATRHQDAAHTQEAVRLERMPPLTDYGHTKPNSLRPKFKSQSQMDWDVDTKAYFFVEIMVE